MIALAPERGDIVAVALSGDYGKPRPALVIQSDVFSKLTSITVLPFSSFLISAPLYRITVEPDAANHLKKTSQIMVDKAVTVLRAKIGKRVGCLDVELLDEVYRKLVRFLGR